MIVQNSAVLKEFALAFTAFDERPRNLCRNAVSAFLEPSGHRLKRAKSIPFDLWFTDRIRYYEPDVTAANAF